MRHTGLSGRNSLSFGLFLTKSSVEQLIGKELPISSNAGDDR